MGFHIKVLLQIYYFASCFNKRETREIKKLVVIIRCDPDICFCSYDSTFMDKKFFQCNDVLFKIH